ncbi:nucleoside deaminase [Tichowtungia aerotolerans]|uniref:tRNA-specific adenosine deaminase n=1 Tax=Tichowtungia aerotolerans TaxID=2697043 RepID=A0A6P1M205_9BACT|nr:nucleoside deaminase [Tichowtungia aerotolerans]QHI68142.1 tRNA-specific adenosine deaminase [Tichowtungia aerotolerans]
MNEAFMREAIALSTANMETGEGGPFGAVVVKNGEIIGRGWNRVTSSNDPTAHAEVIAIRDACAKFGTFDLSGCEIYASCEPCPMCLSAIYWARLDKLYFAAGREDAARAGFDDEWIYREVSKPWNNRELPAEQMLADEARKAFDIWKDKKDRTDY